MPPRRVTRRSAAAAAAPEEIVAPKRRAASTKRRSAAAAEKPLPDVLIIDDDDEPSEPEAKVARLQDPLETAPEAVTGSSDAAATVPAISTEAAALPAPAAPAAHEPLPPSQHPTTTGAVESVSSSPASSAPQSDSSSLPAAPLSAPAAELPTADPPTAAAVPSSSNAATSASEPLPADIRPADIKPADVKPADVKFKPIVPARRAPAAPLELPPPVPRPAAAPAAPAVPRPKVDEFFSMRKPKIAPVMDDLIDDQDPLFAGSKVLQDRDTRLVRAMVAKKVPAASLTLRDLGVEDDSDTVSPDAADAAARQRAEASRRLVLQSPGMVEDLKMPSLPDVVPLSLLSPSSSSKEALKQMVQKEQARLATKQEAVEVDDEYRPDKELLLGASPARLAGQAGKTPGTLQFAVLSLRDPRPHVQQPWPERLSIRMQHDTQMSALFDRYCQLTRRSSHDLLFRFRGVRIYSTTTVKSLDIQAGDEIEVSTLEIDQQRAKLAQFDLMTMLEQKGMSDQKVGAAHVAAHAAAAAPLQQREPSPPTESQNEGAAMVTIKIRQADGTDYDVRIRVSHPVSKLFDYVANKNGMSPGAVELRFDGDKLSGSAIIVDTGIEDEDIVDVVIKGK